MDVGPSIHDAYGGFGQKSEIKSSTKLNLNNGIQKMEVN